MEAMTSAGISCPPSALAMPHLWHCSRQWKLRAGEGREGRRGVGAPSAGRKERVFGMASRQAAPARVGRRSSPWRAPSCAQQPAKLRAEPPAASPGRWEPGQHRRRAHLMLPQEPHFQSPCLTVWPGCRPKSAAAEPGAGAPTAWMSSGLPLPQLLHCSRHWKLRLEQEGQTQSPAGRGGGKAR